MLLAAAALAVLQVGAGFTSGSADGRPAGGGVEVTLTVRSVPGGSVVAHLVAPGDPVRTVAMREVEPGLYRTVFETAPIDATVVFEAVGSGERSEPASLTELGLDPALLGAVAPPEEDRPAGRPAWGWLGVGLALASLAALAVRAALRPHPER